MQLIALLSMLLLGSDSGTPAPDLATPDTTATSPIAFIPLIGDIDDMSAMIVIDSIAASQGSKMILIEINSPGGSVSAGFAISKAIEASNVSVACLVDGSADSMAMYVLQSCDIRMMTKRSVLMIHQPSVGIEKGGRINDFGNAVRALTALNHAMIEHIAARMNIPAQVIVDAIDGNKEMWMYWETAIHFDAVDIVWKTQREALAALRKSVGA